MPRPHKCRKVCAFPRHTAFGPQGPCSAQTVQMTVDEYETIRLMDHEGFTQEQCAARMEVARTTVQAVYAAARRKLAACLVEGHQLQIAGGNVQYCPRRSASCAGGCCQKQP